MENKNYEKTTNLIIKSVIGGWQSMLAFIITGISEAIILAILNIPMLFVLEAVKVPMVVQWIVLDIISAIVLLVFIFIGWAQSKLIGIFMFIMNLFILMMLIMAN